MAVIFIGGGNRSTRRKPPTRRKSLTRQTLSHNVVSSTPRLSGIRGHDCMVVGFTTTYAISAYHH
jgi:hypothetical protein